VNRQTTLIKYSSLQVIIQLNTGDSAMNQLKIEKQIIIASMLVEGNSIRSIERITGVHRDTIIRLGIRLGEQARELSDSLLVNIRCNQMQIDEIWSFVYKKKKNIKTKSELQKGYGDQYVFVALDAETKLVPYFEIGKRTAETTFNFLEELKKRIVTRFQLTTDSYPAYPYAIESVFHNQVDYAQLDKIYNESFEQKVQKRYSPANIIRVKKNPILGNPDVSKISTSYVERQNLTMRMNIRRLTRLTNAFSKKLYNLYCAVSLHFFYYNFMRIHQSLRITPAMQAGVTNHLWNWEDFLGLCSLKQVA
jgi:IS1 family transposase